MSVLETIKSSSVGRPRILTKELILQTAVKLGLENLTLKELANELNVGTTTFYQYFESRSELIEAAAVYTLSDIPLPQDPSLNWYEYAFEFFETIVGILSENITYLQSSQHNGYGQDVVFELTEIFLKAMADKGLSPSQGLRVFQAVSNVSIAAAIQEWRQQDLYGNSTTVYEAVQSAFKGVEPGKLPNLEIVLEEYASPARVHTDILLITYFEAIASERGEKITNNRGTTAINSSTNNGQM
jgi:AcrR family transcriptional regulator